MDDGDWQPGELWEVDESKMSPAATAFSEAFLGIFGSPKANVCYGRSGLLHLGFRALDAYVAAHGRLPNPVDPQAAEAVVVLAQQINASAADKVRARQGRCALPDQPFRGDPLRRMRVGDSDD